MKTERINPESAPEILIATYDASRVYIPELNNGMSMDRAREDAAYMPDMEITVAEKVTVVQLSHVFDGKVNQIKLSADMVKLLYDRVAYPHNAEKRNAQEWFFS